MVVDYTKCSKHLWSASVKRSINLVHVHQCRFALSSKSNFTLISVLKWFQPYWELRLGALFSNRGIPNGCEVPNDVFGFFSERYAEGGDHRRQNDLWGRGQELVKWVSKWVLLWEKGRTHFKLRKLKATVEGTNVTQSVHTAWNKEAEAHTCKIVHLHWMSS